MRAGIEQHVEVRARHRKALPKLGAAGNSFFVQPPPNSVLQGFRATSLFGTSKSGDRFSGNPPVS